MAFDWNLLKPGREITSGQSAIVQEIGLTFIRNGAGTPIHQKKLDLGPARGLLTELEQLGLITNRWDQYYPTFPTLYFLPNAIRDVYAAYLDRVLESVRILFRQHGPRRFQIDEVENATNLVVGRKPIDKGERTKEQHQRNSLI